MATSSSEKILNYPCSDILEFQDVLRKMRTIDDKIVYELNAAIPTISFSKDINVSAKCEDLYNQLRNSYYDRNQAIQHCIKLTNDNSERLRHMQESDPNDSELMKLLRREQLNLRMLKSELSVEEVIKDRSIKVFYEKCRGAYKPPDLLS